MGKGDKRSKRGKIWNRSWGRRRPWRKKRGSAARLNHINERN